jgi:hypothetical protein
LLTVSIRRVTAALALLAIAAAAVLLPARAHAAGAFTDDAITNPSVNDSLVPIGHGRMAERGALSYVLYRSASGWKPFAYVRDTASTSFTHVALPESPGPVGGWQDASYAVATNGDLWVLSGSGPVYVRRYSLSGSPLPTTATLVSATTFGDTDSRAGALTVLASGAVVGVWRQQGYSGPNGLGIAYWNGSAWSTQPLNFMPTTSSKQALVQHPADGSVWLFNEPDAWHGIGVAHLSESAGLLRTDWTDASWIDPPKYGDFGPDPENPDVEAAADPSSGTIVLAYQSNRRQTFTGTTAATGSYPAVARIAASGAPTFVHLPVWVERITALGLVARAGEVWLAYRPINTADNTFSKVQVSRYGVAAGAWDPAVVLGSVYDTNARIGFGLSRVELSFRAGDAVIHRHSTDAPAASPSPTTTSTTSAPSTTSTTTAPKKSPRRK